MASENLLACLTRLTTVIGRPTPNATLIAGLPIINDKLPPELFSRAAARVDLLAKLVNFPLKNQVYHYPIPVVLLMHENEGYLLTDITANDTAKIINPPNNNIEEISLDKLALRYTGQAFIVEPDYHFTSRSAHTLTETREANWFWDAIKKLWPAYSEMLVASFLINIFALAVPLFTMNVYDRVVPNRSFQTLWVLASGIFIVFMFDVLMRSLRSVFIDNAGKLVDLNVSATILERVMGIKMLDRPSSIGSFTNTVQSFDSVREFITSTTMTILVDIPFSILFIFIIGIIGGAIVWVPLILVPLVFVFGVLLQKPLVELTKISHRYSIEKQSILFEALNSIEAVKAHCAENIMQSKWEQAINRGAQVGLKMRLLVNMGMFFSIFVQQLSTVLIVIVGVYEISHNQLTTGALIACTILTSRALAPMVQVATLLSRYHQTKTSLESLNHIMALPVERPPGKVFMHLPKLKGQIELRDLTFQYPGRTFPALKHLSLKIEACEHVGIIGRIGTGKTTMAKLIHGLLQPTSGSIFFDGMDQSHFDMMELRKSIGYVPQDITLFYGSLRENIIFGAPNVEDEKIHQAIKIAGIDEFIKPHVGSYDIPIRDGGKSLSGGQRQIIAIARAILLDPPILVFDEPSHAIDSQTENIIIQRLEPYIKDKTFILMTHRTSMLSLVNRVVIVDQGKIIMDGPKDAVLFALSEGKVKVQRT